MIYTLTLNPAVDYHVHLHQFMPGATNRSSYELIYWGGKGINVSTILQALEVPSVALGFVAGFTGEALENALKARGLCTDFIHLTEGMTRINVKLKADRESEINAAGPRISEYALTQLFAQLAGLKAGDILVLAGSVPSSLPRSLYGDIMKVLDPQVLVVVDAEGDALRSALVFNPFLIKPNLAELEGFLGHTCSDMSQIVAGARHLQSLGARNVLISLGGDGAVLVNEVGDMLSSPAPSGTVLDTVGSGDSMVAGFLAAWVQNCSYEDALKHGIVCGSTTAFTTELGDREWLEMYEKLKK